MRIKLSEKYKNEREQICEQIIHIINLDEKCVKTRDLSQD